MIKHDSTISLDISDFSIKSCRLVRKRGNIFIDSFKSVKVPAGYIEKGKIKERDKVVGLIKKALDGIQGKYFKSKFINTALPEQSTFITLTSIKSDNFSEDSDILESIKNEVSHHIPYSFDEVYVDWQEISSSSRDIKQILVGACPKEVVAEYISIIQDAGFFPISLEIEAIPITRSIFKIQPKQSKSLSSRNIIIIDLGAARSSLIFWKERKYSREDTIEFSVSVPVSGMRINKIIEEKLDLSNEHAEKFKIKCGLETGGKCKGVLKKLLSPLFKEFILRIQQSIEFHNTHFGGASIDKIVLCGGASNLKGLPEFLEKSLNIPVEYANPLVNIKNKNILSKSEALSYATVIGLGLKDFYISSYI